jgi:hypothetical protein
MTIDPGAEKAGDRIHGDVGRCHFTERAADPVLIPRRRKIEAVNADAERDRGKKFVDRFQTEL